MTLEPITPASKIMKIAIHDGGPHTPGTVYLKLFQRSEQEICLAAVDADGEVLLDPHSDAHAGSLLTIAGGHICVSPCLMPSLGFELDATGRIKLDPWAESQMTKHQQKYGGKRDSFRLAVDNTMPEQPTDDKHDPV